MDRFIDDVLNKKDENVIPKLENIFNDKLRDVIFKKLSREKKEWQISN